MFCSFALIYSYYVNILIFKNVSQKLWSQAEKNHQLFVFGRTRSRDLERFKIYVRQKILSELFTR